MAKERIKIGPFSVTLRHGENHGKKVVWMDYKPPGEKRKRVPYPTMAAAKAEVSSMRDQHDKAGALWLSLEPAERTELSLVFREIKAAGLSLRGVWDGYRQIASGSAKPLVSLGDAWIAFEAEITQARLSKRTRAALKSNVGRFIEGREALPVRNIGRDQVMAWLNRPEWGPRTFNSYRLSLARFFNWCKMVGHTAEAPTATIPGIKENRMPDIDEAPAILSLTQVYRLLLAALATDPDLCPFIALGLFAGLRPEREAARLLESEIGPDGTVYVRGVNAKDRQRRFVPGSPTLIAWIKKGGSFARMENDRLLPIKNLRRRFEAVREAAGLIKRVKVDGKERKQIESSGWEQDIMRHSFASHYLPIHGAEKTRDAMGHGNYDMLFRHYRALVPATEAAVYWGLTPDAVAAGEVVTAAGEVWRPELAEAKA